MREGVLIGPGGRACRAEAPGGNGLGHLKISKKASMAGRNCASCTGVGDDTRLRWDLSVPAKEYGLYGVGEDAIRGFLAGEWHALVHAF